MNALAPDPFLEHCRRVDLVADIAAPPKPWTELRHRYEGYLKLATPCRDALVAAVVDGDGDIPTLAALAAAETTVLGQRGPVVNAVRHAVLVKLTEIYAKVSAGNYRPVAKEFDAMAGLFTDTAGQCNPEADAEAMVEASDERRRAWTNAAVFATKLDRLVPVLSAAAQLCGMPESVGRDGGGRDAILLPLVCDPGALHRRRVWEAFAAKGRCGRWSALVELGARIRAAELDTFSVYRAPRPKQYRVVPGSTTTYGATMHWFDPEDAPEPEPAPKPRRRVRQLAR